MSALHWPCTQILLIGCYEVACVCVCVCVTNKKVKKERLSFAKGQIESKLENCNMKPCLSDPKSHSHLKTAYIIYTT